MTLQAELKFKVSRREFKSLIRSKMRANLDYCNRNMLTKNFGRTLNLLKILVKFLKSCLTKD